MWIGENMILKDVLLKGIEILKNAANETPALEAGVMLCFILKQDKTFLYTHDDYTLSCEDKEFFFQLIYKRAKGIPLQYLVGHQEFMSLTFTVTPDVLIPRQDTEILVETVIKYFTRTQSEKLTKSPLELPYYNYPIANGNSVHILDMGTGSGCISVSLAHYIKESCITAVDYSTDALGIACLNALNNGVFDQITFLQSNLFEEVDDYFDAIVSNPPYIKTTEIEALMTEVKDYEPLEALDGGSDGLNFYREIVKKAPKFLKLGGLLAFEVGFDQAVDVSKMMEKDFHHIEVIKDLAGIDRVIMGVL